MSLILSQLQAALTSALADPAVQADASACRIGQPMW